MSCKTYHLDIELLQSLDEDNGRFQCVIDHLNQCPKCLDRYHNSQKLDEILETELNEPAILQSFSTKIMSHIQYSLMPELRRAILEATKSTTTHPPAYWIHQQIKPQFPQIGIRSVCRHLGILKSDGDVLELNFGEGFKRFDGNTEPHCHFFCQQCHGIHDIFQPAEKLVDLTKIQNMGYQISDSILELRGICKNCRVV